MPEKTMTIRVVVSPPERRGPEPPRRISRVSAVYWFFRGIEARGLGHSAEALPFDPDASVTEFFLAHWWLRGWRRGPWPVTITVESDEPDAM